MEEDDGYKVSLNVYDLSQGLARQLSTTFLGKVIDGIWHTGVVVHGNEYFFGGGIQHLPAGTTPYGTPVKVLDLGITHVPKGLFEEYLQEISPRYTAETYDLLRHNCNNFSNEVAQFLVGTTIPNYILEVPNEVMNSPMGAMILPMIQRLEMTMRQGAVPQAPQFMAPAMNQVHQPMTASSAPEASAVSTAMTAATKPLEETPNDSAGGKPENCDRGIADVGKASEKPPAAVKPAREENMVNGEAVDPLGRARSRVQEEISNEFAAIMATGTLRASEAAALATRRVMERHGRLNITMPQS